MAVELEKIQFKDFQEPSVGAENLNKLQDNTQNALNGKQDALTAGDNITIENGVISSTGGGSGDGILTGSIIGWNGEEIPEGYEEVEQIENLSSEVTNLNSTATSKTVDIYKNGKIIFLNFTFQRSGDWTSGDVLFKLSEKVLPITSMFFTACGGGNTIKNININAVNGEVKIIGNTESSNWLSGQVMYFVKEITD